MFQRARPEQGDHGGPLQLHWFVSTAPWLPDCFVAALVLQRGGNGEHQALPVTHRKVESNRKVLSHRALSACLGSSPGTQDRQSSSHGRKQLCWVLFPQKLMGLKFPNAFAVSCVSIRKLPAQDVIPGVPKEELGSVMFLMTCKRTEIR